MRAKTFANYLEKNTARLPVRIYIAKMIRRVRNIRDLMIINRYADRLNQEARDVLDYQRVASDHRSGRVEEITHYHDNRL